MSWNITAERVFFETAERDLADLEPQGQDGTLPHVAQAVSAAKAAAVAMIRSGAYGTGYNFRVTLAGHANVNHRPAKPWTNDTVSVSVSQLDD